LLVLKVPYELIKLYKHDEKLDQELKKVIQDISFVNLGHEFAKSRNELIGIVIGLIHSVINPTVE